MEPDLPLAITDAIQITEKGFETTIVERFNSFPKLDVEEIKVRLGIELSHSSKNYRASLANAMARLITGSTDRKIAEFERSGIVLETILIDGNGLPDQHMSFPTFKYMGDGGILSEAWDAIEPDLEEVEDILEIGTIQISNEYSKDEDFFLLCLSRRERSKSWAALIFGLCPKKTSNDWCVPCGRRLSNV